MNRLPKWSFLLIIFVYLLSLMVDTMDIDASQYACISADMLRTGSYLELYEHGIPYLDKPPFLFWISSLGMALFGQNNLGFKLPSIICALMAIYATYRLGRKLYNEQVGQWAAFMIAASQCFFLITNDIRTDLLVATWVTVTLWCYWEWYDSKKWSWLIGCFAALGLGLMSKGPIAAMVPAIAISGHLLVTQNLKKLLNYRYLVGLLVTAVVIFPMCYGLYTQYDMHPERVVNGLTNVSGLKFFFWSQSFGRITGESPWDNGAGFTYLFENMLWGFLPWTLFFVGALIKRTKQLLFNRQSLKESVTWFGFVPIYCMLALSKYQLPHYLYVVYPLAAIMTAGWVYECIHHQKQTKWFQRLLQLQLPIIVLLWLFVLIITFSAFENPIWIQLVVSIGCVAFMIYLVRSFKWQHNWVWLSGITLILGNLLLTSFFYKPLVDQYQGSSIMGKYIKAYVNPTDTVYLSKTMEEPFNAAHFYAQRPLKDLYLNKGDRPSSQSYVVIDSVGMQQLKAKQYSFDTITHIKSFRVSKLSAAFINKKTRESRLNDFYLIRIN